MIGLTLVNRLLRNVRHRRAVQSLTERDDRILADIDLLRGDVHASLARPYFTDPSKVLTDACCRWRKGLSRFRVNAPVPCC